MRFGDLMQTEDWKNEKHVPVIEAPQTVKAGEPFMVTVVVGKEIPHPNTTEHHIQWIDLHFKPDDDKFSYHVAHFSFLTHGASVKGPNTGPAYTDPTGAVSVKIDRPGTFIATEQCNIHGLWESSMRVEVETS